MGIELPQSSSMIYSLALQTIMQTSNLKALQILWIAKQSHAVSTVKEAAMSLVGPLHTPKPMVWVTINNYHYPLCIHMQGHMH